MIPATAPAARRVQERLGPGFAVVEFEAGEAKVAALLGEPIGRADADFVRAMTGYAIGGVAPVGHATPPRILLDADLTSFAEIWAAAGTPNAVFRLTPADLARLTGAPFADIAKRP